jgi:antirestriction protein ArdC
MSNAVAERVNAAILELIERDNALPWLKPWRGGEPAQNFTSKKPYQGMNTFLNWVGYQSPYWLTYKQASDLGGQVQKGSKGWPVVFYKLLDKKTVKKDGTPEQFPLARYSTLFNASQIDGIDFGAAPATPWEPVQSAEVVAGANWVPIAHDSDHAYYAPRLDSVHMPTREQFDSANGYYSTLLHELGHATGHATRLNRPGITDKAARRATPLYAYEELVAELCSAYTCAATGLENTLEQSAGYVQHWSKRLTEQPDWFFKASRDALKAHKFLLNPEGGAQ